MANTNEFRINTALDVAALAAEFAARGKVSIGHWLDVDCAQAISTHLREREDWVQLVNSGAKTFELSRSARAAMDQSQSRRLDEAVYAGAREGFQYRYESIRVDDEEKVRAKTDDLLNRFARWYSSEEARAFLAAVTGLSAIRFADAQATAYSPGDFLTGHDDDVAGKGRLAAYVFNLTPVWRTEWGGLLLFHDASHREVQGWMPGFNVLNLFAVPQLHSVSEVTRAAAYRRYSITGWLRA
jgi:SM-20-related protein